MTGSSTTGVRRHSTLKVLRIKWQLYLLLLPALIYVIIFSYGPMYGIQIAFKDYKTGRGIWASDWVGLKHFIRFVTYPNFWKIIRNTLAISIYGLSTFPCAVIFALLLNEITSMKYKKTVQMLSYMPHFFSTKYSSNCGLYRSCGTEPHLDKPDLFSCGTSPLVSNRL